jgi:hypothetical protein
MFGLGEKFLNLMQDFFKWIFEAIVQPFTDLPTLKNLVFGTYKEKDLVWKTFDPTDITNAYVPLSHTTMVIAGFILIISIVLAGMRISGVAINPAHRNAFIEFFKDALIVGLLLVNLDTLYSLIFTVNSSLVDIFSGAYNSNIKDIKDATVDDPEAQKGIVGWILIQLTLLGLMLWANFYYMMRKLTLIILMSLGPVMIALYLHPKTKPITMAWFKELTGSVLIQSVHAFVFWTVAVLSAGAGSGLVGSVILYVIFIPVSESMRRLFMLGGEMQGNFAKTGAMFGMSALSGVAGSIRGAMDGKSAGELLGDGYKGIKGGKSNTNTGSEGDVDKDLKNTLGANTGSDVGTSSIAEKMMKPGDIMSRAGKAVFGMAGSIAGSPMGPVGAGAMALQGAAIGGALGGLAGRTGMAVAHGAKDRFKKFGEGFSEGMEKSRPEDLDDAMVEAMADDETTKWASNNEASFMEDLQNRFPDASPQDLQNRWSNEVAKKKEGFRSQAKEDWENIQNTQGQYSDANGLVGKATDDLTNAWANQNKDAFFQDYDKSNPLTEGTSPEEHENRKTDAWNNAVDKKRSQFGDLAKTSAESLQNGNANQPISKQAFGNEISSQLQSLDPKELSVVPGQAPQSKDEVELIYNEMKGERQQAYVNSAAESLNNVTPEQVESGNLTGVKQNLARNLTDSWAGTNKEAFMQQYGQSNPLPDNANAEQQKAHYQGMMGAWDQKVAEKQQQFEQVAGTAVASMTPTLLQSSNGRNQLAATIGQSASGIDQSSFVQQYGSTGQLTAIESQQYAQAQQGHLSNVAQQSTVGAQGVQLMTTRGNVNTPFVAGQIATLQTKSQEVPYIENAMASGQASSIEEAQAQWQAHRPIQHAQNVQSIASRIPASVGSVNKPIIARISSGLNGLTHMAGLQPIQQLANHVALGAQQGWNNSSITDTGSYVQRTVNGAGNAVMGAFQGGKNYIQDGFTQNAIGKEHAFTQALGYGGAVIGGATGYRIGANLARKISPFKSAVAEQISEPSDVIQMAQTTTDDNGNVQVAPGALRMVTTADASYLQVRTKTGDSRIVSRMGAGHSGLRKGETVYQDLSVQDDNLVQTPIKGANTSVYRLDSGGGKIPVQTSLNVSPNHLLGNHNRKGASNNSRQEVLSYNQQVDEGQFFMQDIGNHNMEQVRVVIERNRSYVAASKGGQDYRVSPYYAGDTRLQNSQSVQMNCALSGNTLRTSEVIQYENGQSSNNSSDYVSSLDINKMLPMSPNKRNQERVQYEALRRNQGLIG